MTEIVELSLHPSSEMLVLGSLEMLFPPNLCCVASSSSFLFIVIHFQKPFSLRLCPPKILMAKISLSLSLSLCSRDSLRLVRVIGNSLSVLYSMSLDIQVNSEYKIQRLYDKRLESAKKSNDLFLMSSFLCDQRFLDTVLLLLFKPSPQQRQSG